MPGNWSRWLQNKRNLWSVSLPRSKLNQLKKFTETATPVHVSGVSEVVVGDVQRLGHKFGASGLQLAAIT